ncbi:glyoxalase superfamily protein [Microbacterium gorillae]|uniref:glyoxalase superfamily protein n=1 Tax=Microbacterium gorillae TaxID=1231063 RepID=UPI00058BF8E2|nr:glyoxalase superfamily protein [Microbacterium gorillae]
MDIKIEVVFVPVTDVDRAKQFYVEGLGFHADYDERPDENTRFVQLTPPGSACSIAIGEGLGRNMAPGSLEAVMAVIPDADAFLADVRSRGVEADGVDEQAWGRFVTLRDPDGNLWTFQQLPVWSAGGEAAGSDVAAG